MKLYLSFGLKDEFVATDFRMCIVSFLKKILSSKYTQVYEELYSENAIKDFTFSVYFPNSSIKKNYIYVTEKIMAVTLSGVRDDLMVMFYNAALAYKHYSHPMPNGQIMTLNKVHFANTKQILGDKMVIKFLSPLLVRKHSDEKDTYLTYKDNEFLEYLNINATLLLKSLGIQENLKINNFIPLEAKHTVIKNKELMFQASIGTFVLEADNKLINILYQAGLGSKRGLGFGMFEVMGGQK